MTNKFNNWIRLKLVIERFGKSINSFALSIGLPRAENLYHIRKGNYGISEDLADRIIERDPEIDKTWLLTGIGAMLKENVVYPEQVPFYLNEAEDVLHNIENIEPSAHYTVPYRMDCDLVIRSFSKPMSDTISVAQDLFLKRVDIEDVVQGNEYVLILNNSEHKVLWRRVRWMPRDASHWRLVARNREDFKDIIINRSDVKAAWRVIARMSILES